MEYMASKKKSPPSPFTSIYQTNHFTPQHTSITPLQVLLYTAGAGLFTMVPTFYIEAAYKKVFYQVNSAERTMLLCASPPRFLRILTRRVR
jgi:hypothetical protein